MPLYALATPPILTLFLFNLANLRFILINIVTCLVNIFWFLSALVST